MSRLVADPYVLWALLRSIQMNKLLEFAVSERLSKCNISVYYYFYAKKEKNTDYYIIWDGIF